jgi:DNA polymerase I-like protein with 3'-5' exonuclease and polymerase domains
VRVSTIDFETKAIQRRPDYPPKPVGVAIKRGGQRSTYLAWGHPTGNNVTMVEAKRALRKVWKSGDYILCHNAKFDLEVACCAFGLALPNWWRIHCTMLMAFIMYPNVEVLSLKPLAEKYLGLPPSEELKLQEWLVLHVPEVRRKPKRWGEFIAEAPGRLVSPYARGDVDRTWQLYKLWCTQIIQDNGLSVSYDRERRSIPMMLDMENRGIPVDVPGLHEAIINAEDDLDRVENWLRRKLKAPSLEFSKREQLADALEDSGMVKEWIITPKAYKRGTSIPDLEEVVLNKHVMGALKYRALIAHQLSTFARPWLEMCQDSGIIMPSWNQVRQADERQRGRAIGARTGRFSSSPNVQNIYKRIRPLVTTLKEFKKELKRGSEPLLVPFPDLGLIDLRALIKAPRGKRFVNLDYRQQELRILAHFEAGELWQAYMKNPDLDQHQLMTDIINNLTYYDFSRDQIKNTGFGIIYGMGIDLLAEKINEEPKVAKTARDAYKKVLPGVQKLDKFCKLRGRRREPIRTWGGRLYYAEEPKFIGGVLRTFDYKLLNVLIQGSAADCTKEAMVRYFEDKEREGDLVLSVHDEIMSMVPTKAAKREFKRLKKHMESIEFHLPMLTDGNIGVTWRACK